MCEAENRTFSAKIISESKLLCIVQFQEAIEPFVQLTVEQLYDNSSQGDGVIIILTKNVTRLILNNRHDNNLKEISCELCNYIASKTSCLLNGSSIMNETEVFFFSPYEFSKLFCHLEVPVCCLLSFVMHYSTLIYTSLGATRICYSQYP